MSVTSDSEPDSDSDSRPSQPGTIIVHPNWNTVPGSLERLVSRFAQSYESEKDRRQKLKSVEQLLDVLEAGPGSMEAGWDNLTGQVAQLKLTVDKEMQKPIYSRSSRKIRSQLQTLDQQVRDLWGQTIPSVNSQPYHRYTAHFDGLGFPAVVGELYSHRSYSPGRTVSANGQTVTIFKSPGQSRLDSIPGDGQWMRDTQDSSKVSHVHKFGESEWLSTYNKTIPLPPPPPGANPLGPVPGDFPPPVSSQPISTVTPTKPGVNKPKTTTKASTVRSNGPGLPSMSGTNMPIPPRLSHPSTSIYTNSGFPSNGPARPSPSLVSAY